MKIKNIPIVKVKPGVKISPLKVKPMTMKRLKKILPELLDEGHIDAVEDVLSAYLIHVRCPFSVKLVKIK